MNDSHILFSIHGQAWNIFEHIVQLITFSNLLYNHKTNLYLGERNWIIIYVFDSIVLWDIVQVFKVIANHFSHCIIPGDGTSFNCACCVLKKIQIQFSSTVSILCSITLILFVMSLHFTKYIENIHCMYY